MTPEEKGIALEAEFENEARAAAKEEELRARKGIIEGEVQRAKDRAILGSKERYAELEEQLSLDAPFVIFDAVQAELREQKQRQATAIQTAKDRLLLGGKRWDELQEQLTLENPYLVGDAVEEEIARRRALRGYASRSRTGTRTLGDALSMPAAEKAVERLTDLFSGINRALNKPAKDTPTSDRKLQDESREAVTIQGKILEAIVRYFARPPTTPIPSANVKP